MKRFLVFSLILILLAQLVGSALAQDDDELLLQHWVIGAVTPYEEVNAAGQTIKLQLDEVDKPAEFTSVIVSGGNTFSINAYRISGYEAGDAVTLSVVPFEEGDFSYKAELSFTTTTDGWEEKTLPLVEGPPLPSDLAFTIEDGADLDAATLNVYCEFDLVNGGVLPYEILTLTGLPPGLDFNINNGMISGTPLETGPFPFNISIKDNANDELQGNFNIFVGEIPVSQGTVLLGISRDINNNIDVSWTVGALPEIHYLTRADDQIFDNINGWALLDFANLPVGVILADKKITWTSAAHAGYQAIYFKGLDGSDPLALADAHPVAMIKFGFDVDDLKLTVVPLTVGSAQDAVAGQVPDGVIKLYPRIGGGINVNEYSNDGGWVAGDFTISPTVGFWLRNSTETELTLTFVGVLPLINYEKTLQPLDMTGNPLPMPLTFDVNQGEVGDKIYPQAGKGLSVFELVDAGWQGGDKDLALGEGFWYRSGDGTDRKWEINPKDGTAVLKK